MDPRSKARLAGILYLIGAVPAGFAVFLFRSLVVRDDAATTATNILASEGVFRLAFVADVLSVVVVIVVTILLYVIFKPVSGEVAMLALILGIIGNVVQALAVVPEMVALQILQMPTGPTGISVGQAQSLALTFLQVHILVLDLSLLFFGLSWIAFGYLTLRSTFMPRALGPLLAVDGLGYFVSAVVVFLSPPIAAHLSPFLPYGTVILGEVPFFGWLIVKGVDSKKWSDEASAADRSRIQPPPG